MAAEFFKQEIQKLINTLESRSRTSPSSAMRHLLRTNPLPGLSLITEKPKWHGICSSNCGMWNKLTTIFVCVKSSLKEGIKCEISFYVF